MVPYYRFPVLKFVMQRWFSSRTDSMVQEELRSSPVLQIFHGGNLIVEACERNYCSAAQVWSEEVKDRKSFKGDWLNTEGN